MAKKLCDLKKLLRTDFELFEKYVSDPTHVCKKCGRVANSKRRLCKPKKFKNGKDALRAGNAVQRQLQTQAGS